MFASPVEDEVHTIFCSTLQENWSSGVRPKEFTLSESVTRPFILVVVGVS